MKGADLLILYVNSALAAVAALVNFLSGRVSPSDWKPVRYFIAFFAAFYSVGYLVLALGFVPFELWSRFFRGMSLFVWPVVWITPAWLAGSLWTELDNVRKGVEK